MKILFAIQATGNGHLSRAREIIPHLLNHGDVDLLVSGTDAEVILPYMVKYQRHGLGYVFGKKGGIDYAKSIKKFKPFNLLKDIYTLPVHEYDVVINDFEPVTAWACKLKRKPCIALSHQAAYLSQYTPRPHQRDLFAEQVFKYYAPVSMATGLHFEEYDSFIRKPVIRSEVRQLEPTHENHITVYLPAYDDILLVEEFLKIKDVEWHVFTKHSKKAYRAEHINVYPIENDAFLKSMASSSGLLTGGGFEGPAEALFLGKKIMSLPMMGQYEQQCNALALKKLGVTVVSGINEHFYNRLRCWLEFGKPITVDYPDQTASLVEDTLQKYMALSHEMIPGI